MQRLGKSRRRPFRAFRVSYRAREHPDFETESHRQNRAFFDWLFSDIDVILHAIQVYVQKRNEIVLEDTASGFLEGRWMWNVTVEGFGDPEKNDF